MSGGHNAPCQGAASGIAVPSPAAEGTPTNGAVLQGSSLLCLTLLPRATAPLTAGNGATATNAQLMEVLQSVATGVLTADDGAVQLGQLVQPGQSRLGGADAAAAQRAAFPEVVWGEHKGAAQIAAALQRIAETQGMAAATRVAPRVAAEVAALLPDVQYSETARMLTLKSATTKQHKLPGSVALICAGTADARVVEECRLMLQNCGCYSFKLAESGVMGMHR